MNYKRLLIKTFLAFGIFYMVMMNLFTVFQYKADVKRYELSFNNLFNKMRNRLTLEIAESDAAMQSPFNDNLYKQSIENLISDLKLYMTTGINGFVTPNTYGKMAIYDGKYNLLAKTGNFLRCGEAVVTEDSSTANSRKMWTRYRTIDLDQYLSKEEITDLFSIHRKYLKQAYEEQVPDKKYRIRVIGYVRDE